MTLPARYTPAAGRLARRAERVKFAAALATTVALVTGSLLVAGAAHASGYNSFTNEDGVYTYVNDGSENATIVRFIQAAGTSGNNITIPDSLDGHTVVAVGNDSPYGGSWAFGGLTAHSLTLPSMLQSVNHAGFADMRIAVLNLDDNLTSIGYAGFYDNFPLRSISIPQSVTSIGEYAFSWNTSLTSAYFEGAAPSIIAAGGNGSFGENASNFRITSASPFLSARNGLWQGYPYGPLALGFGTNTTLPGTLTSGTAYSQTITTTGDPTTVTLDAATRHYGLSASVANNRVTISGMPNAPTPAGNDVNATITIGNPSDTTATYSQSFRLTIAPAAITISADFPDATEGTPYSVNVTTTGDGTVELTNPDGELAAYGLTIAAVPDAPHSWTISGSPTDYADGTNPVQFTLRAVNAFTDAPDMSYTLNIAPMGIMFNTTTLPNPRVGVAYNQTIDIAADATLSVVGTGLPAGLSVATDENGVVTLSGTPTAAGPSEFTLTASSSSGAMDVEQQYAVTVAAAFLPLRFATTTLHENSYSDTNLQVTLAQNDGGVTFSTTDMFAGTTLALSSDGMLTGQAPAGVYNIPITATSSNAPYVEPITETLVLTVNQVAGNPVITTTTLPNALVGMAYSQQVEATGTAPVTFTATGLPAGLTISASGLITGTVTAVGSNAVVINASTEVMPEATLSTTLKSIVAPSTATLTLGFAAGSALAKATVSISAADLLAGSSYTVTLHSDPVVISAGTIDRTGMLSLTGVTIPAGTPAGSHRIVLSAIAADGSTVTSTAYFSILADGTIGKTSYISAITIDGLAKTGVTTDPALPLGAAVLLLLVGGALVVLRRKRLN